MPVLDEVVRLVAPWHHLFARSRPLEMATVGTHVLSMLVAGGLAIAHDRGSLRASGRTDVIRSHHLGELRAVHRPVVAALGVCMASGMALFASDVETYAYSLTFWIKLSLIALLLVNALMMQSSERTLSMAAAGGAVTVAWSRIRVNSVVSMALWVSIVLISIVLSLEK